MRSPVRLVMRKGMKYQPSLKPKLKLLLFRKMVVTQKMLEKRKEGR